MNKQQILAAIQEYIKANGLQEITGTILNTILKSIANIIPDDAMLTSSFGGVVNANQTIPFTTGLGRWFIANAGTYANNGGFTFTDKNLNILSYDGATWDKVEVYLPESKAFIPAFSTMPFPLSGDVQVTDNDRFWQLIAGKTALATDIPSDDSTIWKSLGGGAPVDIDEELSPIKTFLGDYLVSGDAIYHSETNEWTKGAFQYPNLDIYEDGTEPDLKRIKIDTKLGRTLEVSYVSGNAGNQALLKTLIGQKSNGSLVVLEEMNKPNNPIISKAIYDVTHFDYVYFNVIYSTGYDSIATLYSSDISKNLEKILEPFSTVLESFFKEVDTEITSNDSNSIYGKSQELGILKVDNTIEVLSSPDYIYKTYRNVPTAGLQMIDFEFHRYGAPYPSLLGIKENGDIVVIIEGGQGQAIDFINIDITPYKFISFSMVKSVLDTGGSAIPKQSVKFYKIGYNVPKQDSVMKAIKAISNGSKDFGFKTDISLRKPTSLVRINLLGELPTDTSEARAKTNMKVQFFENNSLVFETKVENKIQGTSTAHFDKKNWNLKFFNNEDKAVKIKFGKWSPDSSFHLKAFVGDLTMSRDTGGARLYGQILNSRPFPQSYGSQFPQIVSNNDQNISNFFNDSGYFLDGFPLELYVNDTFHGIYILRQRRENEIYHMNSANKKNIYLANDNLVPFNLDDPFDPFFWELKSPKLPGYETTQPIPDAVVNADIKRLFDWFVAIKNNTVDFEATASQYINIDNWVDVIIHSQLVQNWDFYVNNQNLCTYDGLTWFIHPTDLNWTTGLFDIRYQEDKYSKNQVQKLHWRGSFFPDVLYPKLLNRIKIRYAELKTKGVVDLNNIYNVYNEIPAIIGSKLIIEEDKKWSSLATENIGIQSTQYIMQFYIWKIQHLNTIWS